MRVRSLILPISLALLVPLAAQAQPKKAGAGVQKRGRAAPKTHAPAPAPAPATEESGSDNPYGGTAAPPAADPSSTSTEAAAAPTEAGSSTLHDPKLDAAPPPRSDKPEGPKPSPLTPEANEFSKGAPPPGPAALDRLMAEIATLRARVASLTTSLFSSKLKVSVQTDGDESRIQNFVVTLDDGVVFTSGPGFLAEDERAVYEHAVAPGNHVIGIEIERQDARGAAYRTWQTSRFAISVPERKVLEASVVVEDDSDMADDFPDDQDGTYELGVELRAAVQE